MIPQRTHRLPVPSEVSVALLLRVQRLEGEVAELPNLLEGIGEVRYVARIEGLALKEVAVTVVGVGGGGERYKDRIGLAVCEKRQSSGTLFWTVRRIGHAGKDKKGPTVCLWRERTARMRVRGREGNRNLCPQAAVQRHVLMCSPSVHTGLSTQDEKQSLVCCSLPSNRTPVCAVSSVMCPLQCGADLVRRLG